MHKGIFHPTRTNHNDAYMHGVASKFVRATQDEGLNEKLHIPLNKREAQHRVVCLPKLFQGLMYVRHRNDRTSFIRLPCILVAMLPPSTPKFDNLPSGKELALAHPPTLRKSHRVHSPKTDSRYICVRLTASLLSMATRSKLDNSSAHPVHGH